MSWTSWACVGVIAVGFVLFLYGANFYATAIGFAGLLFLVAGLIGALVAYIYSELTKRDSQNP